MATPYDESLLEWHVTGQLAMIAVDNRRVIRVGDPAMLRSFDFSPDGRHARVTTMHRPFSYVVPVTSFGRVEEIWDREGNVLAEIADTELNTGIRGVPSAPGVAGDEEEADRRQIMWREDGAGLTFLRMEPAPEEEEGDEAAAEEEDDEADTTPEGSCHAVDGSVRRGRHDRSLRERPAHGEPPLLVGLRLAFRHPETRRWRRRRWWWLRRRAAGAAPSPSTLSGWTTRRLATTISEWDSDEFYANPGSLLMDNGQAGGGGGGGRFGGGGGSVGSQTVEVVGDDGSESVFLMGTNYNEDPLAESPISFLDRVALRTGDTERVYESSNDGEYERITTVLDAGAGNFVVHRESPTEVGQSSLVDGEARTQLTQNVDYTPDLTNAPRDRFTVERPDGFRFLVKRHHAARLRGRRRATRDVLVLPARIRGPGVVRRTGTHLQQERLPQLRHPARSNT